MSAVDNLELTLGVDTTPLETLGNDDYCSTDDESGDMEFENMLKIDRGFVAAINDVECFLWLDKNSKILYWCRGNEKSDFRLSWLNLVFDVKSITYKEDDSDYSTLDLECFDSLSSVTYLAAAYDPTYADDNVPQGKLSVEDTHRKDVGSKGPLNVIKHIKIEVFGTKGVEMLAIMIDQFVALLEEGNKMSMRRLTYDGRYTVHVNKDDMSGNNALASPYVLEQKGMDLFSDITLYNTNNISGDSPANHNSSFFKKYKLDTTMNLRLKKNVKNMELVNAGTLATRTSSRSFFSKKLKFVWIDILTNSLCWCRGLYKDNSTFKSISIKNSIDSVELIYSDNKKKGSKLIGFKVIEHRVKKSVVGGWLGIGFKRTSSKKKNRKLFEGTDFSPVGSEKRMNGNFSFDSENLDVANPSQFDDTIVLGDDADEFHDPYEMRQITGSQKMDDDCSGPVSEYIFHGDDADHLANVFSSYICELIDECLE